MTINDSNRCAVPFRLDEPLGRAADFAQRRVVDRGPPTPTAQAVLEFPARRQVERRRRHDATSASRTHILGDIVDSGAVPVGAPASPTTTPAIPATRRSQLPTESRTPMVYVGGNDGMLHAFDDSNQRHRTPARKPGRTFPRRSSAAATRTTPSHTPSPEFQLGALSYRRGGIPLFAAQVLRQRHAARLGHRFRQHQHAARRRQSGNDWRTILVGGLGAGGRAVYALDVTDSGRADRHRSGDRVLGSRAVGDSRDRLRDLGYVFDAPTLVKTQALRLGGARRLRVQQSGRQGHPLRPEPDETATVDVPTI